MKTDRSVNSVKEAFEYGQSLWYDGLLSPADFKKLIDQEIVYGATTNPSIFEKALSLGQLDAKIKGSSESRDPEIVYRDIAASQVQEICDVFLSVYQATSGQDGFVSIEVSPMLAHNTQGTIDEALWLAKTIQRPNLMIKIPATVEGLPAIESVLSAGISVNVTLIFSIERYRQVMAAYLAGIEGALASKRDIRQIRSVASFFVSRLDSMVDAQLDKYAAQAMDNHASSARACRGKAAIANSRLAYAAFEQVFHSDRFLALAAKSANLQRPLWASTGTKNPAYSDVLYVDNLIGQHTVNTMPPATLDAFIDHGKPRKDSATEQVSESMSLLEGLSEYGISLEKNMEDLESQGVRLFQDAYQKIITVLREKMS